MMVRTKRRALTANEQTRHLLRRPVSLEWEDGASERCVGGGDGVVQLLDEEGVHLRVGYGQSPKSQAKSGKLAALAPRTCTLNFCCPLKVA